PSVAPPACRSASTRSSRATLPKGLAVDAWARSKNAGTGISAERRPRQFQFEVSPMAYGFGRGLIEGAIVAGVIILLIQHFL
ncbi:hypothetical protein, partial [Mesorhizobium sp.]|uniref:hypothetical protein n=1 Tax=Mesorhizobium sp. TaxID=1871066 RepID=UPI0025CDC5A6